MPWLTHAAGISSLVHLDTLSLSMNCLLRLPPGLEQLSALSRLDLRHNQLRQAPGALTQLKVRTEALTQLECWKLDCSGS